MEHWLHFKPIPWCRHYCIWAGSELTYTMLQTGFCFHFSEQNQRWLLFSLSNSKELALFSSFFKGKAERANSLFSLTTLGLLMHLMTTHTVIFECYLLLNFTVMSISPVKRSLRSQTYSVTDYRPSISLWQVWKLNPCVPGIFSTRIWKRHQKAQNCRVAMECITHEEVEFFIMMKALVNTSLGQKPLESSFSLLLNHHYSIYTQLHYIQCLQGWTVPLHRRGLQAQEVVKKSLHTTVHLV